MPRADFKSWQSNFGVAFDLDLPSGRADSFRGSIDFHSANDLLLCFAKSSRIDYLRSSAKVISSGLDQILVRLILKGELRFSFDATNYVAEQGNIVVADLSRTSFTQCATSGTPLEEIMIWFPRHALIDHVPDAGFLHGVLKDPNDAAFSSLDSCARFIQRMEHSPGIKSINDCHRLLKTITLDKIINSAAAPTSRGAVHAREVVPYAQVKQFIEANLTSPKLTVAGISKSLGISRASLYRIFGPAGGVASLVRQRRLEAALKEMTSPERISRQIGLISSKWGFKNLSAFSRAFHAQYKMTPREARALVWRSAEIRSANQREAGDTDLDSWLRKTGRP